MNRWMFKLAGRDVYQLVTSGLEQTNRTSGDCTFEGTSTVTVTMTEALDGATYMCYTGTEVDADGTPTQRDRVVIKLHGKQEGGLPLWFL